MRYFLGAAIMLFVSLLQASSVEQFHPLGVSPNLVLVLLMSWLVVRGLDDVLPMVAVAGVTLGFIGMQAPGLVLLALIVPVAIFGAVRELHIIHSQFLLCIGFVVGSTLLYESILLLSVAATGGSLDIADGASSVLVPAMLVNLVIAPPVYAVMRLAKPHPMQRLAF